LTPLALPQQDTTQSAVQKFVDSLLDLLVPNGSVVEPPLVSPSPEMLFIGPDKTTAEFMDWASNHARKRGCVIGWKNGFVWDRK